MTAPRFEDFRRRSALAPSPPAQSERARDTAPRLRFPVTQDPPPNAEIFVKRVVNVAAPAGATTVPAALVLNLAERYAAVIRSISISITSLTASTTLIYQLRLGGVPVAGFDNLGFYPKVANSETATWELPKLFNPTASAQVIDIALVNVEAIAYNVGVEYEGWIWDATEAEAVA